MWVTRSYFSFMNYDCVLTLTNGKKCDKKNVLPLASISLHKNIVTY